jgi:hypothetical protein
MISPALHKSALKNIYNNQYIGFIYVGKDSQEFRVIFDTGSNWLWIPNTNCSGCSKEL